MNIEKIVSSVVLLSVIVSPAQAGGFSEERIESKEEWLSEACGDRLSSKVRVAMANTQVVDFHSHTFNLNYLPVQGILLRYRVPTPVAWSLANILLKRTDGGAFEQEYLEESTSDPLEDFIADLDQEDLQELARHERALRKAVKRVRRQGEGLPGVGGEPAVEPPLEEDADDGVNPGALRSLNLLLELMGEATHSEEAAAIRERATTQQAESFGDVQDAIAGFLRMAALLTWREDRISYRLQDEFPAVDLFVHHMMDLEHVYAAKHLKPPKLTLPQQLKRVTELEKLSGGRLRFSVAFDPFRGEEAFEHVENAIKAGAVAIKFYPPSGYQASGTAVPWKPSFFTARFPFLYLPFSTRLGQIHQWNSRYGKGAEVVQERIDRLVDLAVEHDIPIFSHHTPQGFEAMADESRKRQGYGKMMAAPKAWLGQLKRQPKLRLVLAHSGGGEGWFGEADWRNTLDIQAYDLCSMYENVYCDFGMSTEVLEEEGRRAFRQRLEQLISPCEKGSHDCAGRPYDIRSKILYGSDWHMIVQNEDREDLICSFGEVFSSEKLQDAASLFFGENALRAAPSLARPDGED